MVNQIPWWVKFSGMEMRGVLQLKKEKIFASKDFWVDHERALPLGMKHRPRCTTRLLSPHVLLVTKVRPPILSVVFVFCWWWLLCSLSSQNNKKWWLETQIFLRRFSLNSGRVLFLDIKAQQGKWKIPPPSSNTQTRHSSSFGNWSLVRTTAVAKLLCSLRDPSSLPSLCPKQWLLGVSGRQTAVRFHAAVPSLNDLY